ncbi:MAG: QueT transporter family protein [Coriobacteriia bacterium]|nr:QueT transporter family protein [Coriobacteriia bacterium]
MSRTRYIAQAGVIAAVYCTLTLLTMQLLQGLAWGPVQFRVSEAFTVIAMLTPAGVPGLALGSVIANALNPAALWPLAGLDVVFGSLATLLGAVWMRRFARRRAIALAGPVIMNALIVPVYLPIMLAGLGFYTVPFFGVNLEGTWLGMYLFGVAAVGVGEAVVVYAVGWPLLAALERIGITGFIGPKG